MGDTHHVVEWVGGGSLKHTRYFVEAFILGHLESLDKAFLGNTCVPNHYPIGEHRDDKGIVYFPPV